MKLLNLMVETEKEITYVIKRPFKRRKEIDVNTYKEWLHENDLVFVYNKNMEAYYRMADNSNTGARITKITDEYLVIIDQILIPWHAIGQIRKVGKATTPWNPKVFDPCKTEIIEDDDSDE